MKDYWLHEKIIEVCMKKLLTVHEQIIKSSAPHEGLLTVHEKLCAVDFVTTTPAMQVKRRRVSRVF